MADNSILLNAALEYAENGTPVFPCNSKKKPLVATGFYAATTDPKQIREWWETWPDAWIGMPTGAASGLNILDMDIKPGIDGRADLFDLEQRHGKLPDTIEVITPSGGGHLHFKHPPGVRTKSNSKVLAPGIDLRGDGGYVIMPPSPGYEFEASNVAEPAMLNGWLLPHFLADAVPDTPDPAPTSATVDPDLAGRLVDQIIEGSPLHDSLRDLAAHLRAVGTSEYAATEILQSLMKRSKARTSRPGDWQERFNDIGRLVASAGKYATEPSPAFDTTSNPWDDPADIGRLLSTPPLPMMWAVVNILQLGRGAVVSGIGGSSKTRLLYHIAIGVIVGSMPWNWEIGSTGKAVLVLTEDTADDLQRTLHAICNGMGLSKDQRELVQQNLVVYPLAGRDVKLLARNESKALVKTPHFENLVEKVNDMGGVKFVAIDPALSITQGDESDQNDQRMVGKMVDDLAVQTGAACLLAAHSTKASQQADELTSHSSRGAGAITDAVRAEFAMRTMTASEAGKAGITDLEERKRHVQLVVTKANHLPPAAFVPIWLRRGDGGVLSAADIEFDQGGNSGPNAKDMQALDILREMAKTTSPKLADWRQRCVDAGVITDGEFKRQEKAMQRTIKRLVAAGLAERGFSRGVYQPVIEQ